MTSSPRITVAPSDAARPVDPTASGWIGLAFSSLAVTLLAGGLLMPADGVAWAERLALTVGAAGAPILGGLLVLKRPLNRYGWLWVAFGLALAALVTAHGWASVAAAPQAALPQAGAAALVAGVGWAATFAVAPLLLLLFPDGSLPSDRWRFVALAVAVAGPLAVASGLFAPGETGLAPVENPLGIPGPLGAGMWVVLYVSVFVLLLATLASAGSVIVRYRRAAGLERRQISWLAYAAALLAGLIVFSGILGAELPRPWQAFLLAAGFGGLYVGVGMAVLRHRLYQIDLVINRTLVYGALTLGIAALYLGLVAGLELILGAERTLGTSLLAAAVVAIVFAPARDRLQRIANRLIYGERDDPYTAISRLGRRLETTLEPRLVLPRIVEDVARTLRLPWTAIWLVEGSELVPAATHGAMPDDRLRDPAAVAALGAAPDAIDTAALPAGPLRAALDALRGALVIPLVYRGKLLAALVLAARGPGDSFTAADRRLVRDLALQAGAAVNGWVLAEALRGSLEDLRRSRERLVRHQDEERRRIQRDLHDGLGPILASLRVRLEAVLEPVERTTPDIAEELQRTYELVGQATAEIRRLVYGLRPPALDQIGLAGVLRQDVERFERETGVSVELLAPERLETAPVAEVALLRIAQEALVNVGRHAAATRVSIRLSRADGWLGLEIADDGRGIPIGSAHGTGLSSIRERAEELGGALSVASSSGAGTTLKVRIPEGETDA